MVDLKKTTGGQAQPEKPVSRAKRDIDKDLAFIEAELSNLYDIIEIMKDKIRQLERIR